MVNNLMLDKFVQVVCDVDCVWDSEAPSYRVFVNNELFTERTWIWQDQYLEEMLQILAKPGRYQIDFSLIDPSLGTLITKNLRVIKGEAKIINNNILEILP